MMTHKDWSNYAGGTACFIAGFLAINTQALSGWPLSILFLIGAGLVGENSVPELIKAIAEVIK